MRKRGYFVIDGGLVDYTPANGIPRLMGNGIVEQTSWNDRFQLTGLTAGKQGLASAVTLGFYPCANSAVSCSSGNNGNIRTQTISAPGFSVNQSYQYEVERLTGASESGGTPWNEAYKYSDPQGKLFGNRWIDTSARIGLPGLTLETPQSSAWYLNNNQINLWSTDSAGNVLSVGSMARGFTYDAENRQITATINGVTSTYVYDGQGQRAQKTAGGVATTYVYDAGGELAAEYSSQLAELGCAHAQPKTSWRTVEDAHGCDNAIRRTFDGNCSKFSPIEVQECRCMNRADLALAIHGCLPRRPTQDAPETGIRGYEEFGSAETIAAELFRRDFERRYPGNSALFTSQADYRRTDVPGLPGVRFLLNMMKEHFRNIVSPRDPMRDGGFRKPDGMCIAPVGRRILVELLEVKPVRNLQDGQNQIKDMIRILRNGLNDALRGQTGPGGFGADDFNFLPTEWRPGPEEMVCPLLNPAGTQDLTWACFDAMRNREKVEGVLLYELHGLSFAGAQDKANSIASPIADRIKDACDSRGWKMGGSSTSWQELYCATNPTDVAELRQLAGITDWSGLAAGLAFLLSQSNQARAAAAVAGRNRTLLESTVPLTVTVGAVTVVEPAIHEAILLSEAIRRRG